MKKALSPILALLSLSLILPSSAFALNVVRGQLARDLNSFLLKEAESSFSGVVLIARAGAVILHRAYGQSDREVARLNTVDTVFDIGSVAQVFTAMAILRLEEEGALRTSDPITRFFRAVPLEKRRITVHHLLSHSSGLLETHSESDYELLTRQQGVTRILASELNFEPGQGYGFSTSGYTLLASIVETASGKHFRDYLREVILDPVGMNQTGFRDERRLEPAMARGYATEFDRGSPSGWPAPTWETLGSGGMVSSAQDLFRLHEAIEKNIVLQLETRLRMETAYSSVGVNTFFGYGWQLKETPYGMDVGSAAVGRYGFSTMVRRVVDQGLVMIVLANRSEGTRFPILPVSRGILELLLEGGSMAID